MYEYSWKIPDLKGLVNMIAIIDYDAGNIKSVEKAIQFLGEEAVITRDPEKILSAEGVILPGVGSFGDAMARIRSYEPVSYTHLHGRCNAGYE